MNIDHKHIKVNFHAVAVQGVEARNNGQYGPFTTAAFTDADGCELTLYLYEGDARDLVRKLTDAGAGS